MNRQKKIADIRARAEYISNPALDEICTLLAEIDHLKEIIERHCEPKKEEAKA